MSNTAHTGKFVAYYRVSTARQGRSGLGLEAQQKAVLDYLNGGSWELIEEFTEVESGKRADRKELAAALKACKKSGATLVVAKLDRLARNLGFVVALMESGVEFICCDMPQANKFTIQILAAVAENERDNISVRTKAGLAAAKARGVVLGNPDIANIQKLGGAATKAKAVQHAENIMPVINQIMEAGIVSYRGIAKALEARGLKTAKGGDWGPQQVKNIIARAGNDKT
ncbi:MAG: recombinase family protein [Alphaproteobacteria bacterium]|nr:recombinase family protein [Alphaproteobacteria bacterium]